MKTIKCLAIVATVAMAITVAGCIGTGSDSPKKNKPKPFPDNVKYFGYFASDIGPYNYMAEVEGHSNVAFVSGFASADSIGYEKKLAQARTLGMKVMLEVRWFFFDGSNKIRPTIQEKKGWEHLASVIRQYDDVILGFYNLDEPYWNKGVPENEMLGQLELVGRLLKESFPSKKMLVIFAYPSVHEGLVLPKWHDWFGFDFYDNWRDVPGYLNVLKSKVSAMSASDGKDRKLVLVPPSAKGPSNTESGLVKWADKYVDLARNDKDVIAIFPFLWQDLPPSWTGTRSMPSVMKKYKQIGSKISGK